MNPRRPIRGPVARLFCLVGIAITLLLVMAPLAAVAGDDAAQAGFFDLDRLPGPIAFAAHRKVLWALGAGDLDRHPEE